MLRSGNILRNCKKPSKNKNKNLKKQKQDDDALIDIAENERDKAVAESQQFKAQHWRLQHRVKALEEELKKAGQSTQPEIPDNLDEFEKWCDETLSGFVEVHNRAFRAVKGSLYRDPSLIFKALLVLRDYYVPMRQRQEGEDHLKEKFEKECQKLGIMEAQSIDKSRKGEEGDAYHVKYLGEPRFLDRHLKNKGSSRDPSRCFRLYFFWDDENRQVVVGWLPSHLSTRVT